MRDPAILERALARAASDAVDGSVRFGVRPEIATDLENREVVLVIDEGPYWFELVMGDGQAAGVPDGLDLPGDQDQPSSPFPLRGTLD